MGSYSIYDDKTDQVLLPNQGLIGKHSLYKRFTLNLDWAKEWFSLSCSNEYFNQIEVIKNQSDIVQINNEMKFLKIFKDELLNLSYKYPNALPSGIIKYLILNRSGLKANMQNPTSRTGIKTNRLKTPTRIIELDFNNKIPHQLDLICNNAWQIGFRARFHTYKTKPMMWFEMALKGHPLNFFSNYIYEEKDFTV